LRVLCDVYRKPNESARTSLHHAAEELQNYKIALNRTREAQREIPNYLTLPKKKGLTISGIFSSQKVLNII
jgi:flagellar biosynthesis chaperone FliJ